MIDSDDINLLDTDTKSPDGPAPEGESATESSATIYIAHYTSPVNETPTKGFFEFESTNRASTKSNIHDARLKMLEIYGKQAVSWVIDEVRIKKKKNEVCGDQIELDFRAPKPVRKRRTTKKWL